MTDLLTKFNYTNQVGDIEEITDCEQLTINFGDKAKNNTCTLTLKNQIINLFPDGTEQYNWVSVDGLPIFQAIKVSQGEVVNEEVIDIYALYTESDPTIDVENTDFLLFSAIITDSDIDSKKEGNKIKLTAKNRTGIILDTITQPIIIKLSNEKNAPELIQQTTRAKVENVTSNQNGFDNDGNTVVGAGFLVDSRLFTEGVKESGTITTLVNRVLTDSSATFITNGVSKGHWVKIKTSTRQYIYVESVDSETQITITQTLTGVTDASTTYEVSDGFIQDERINNSVFPDIKLNRYGKPLSDTIAFLSQTENTNPESERTSGLIHKRAMRWFIDRQNRLHWYYPQDTPQYFFEDGATTAVSPDTVFHRIQNITLNNKVQDRINYIIYKAGEDMDNDMIKFFSRAPFSGVPQVKESERKWLDIARDMKSHSEKEGNIIKSTGEIYAYPVSYDPLPNGDTFPVWDTIKNITPTSDSEYNTVFINNARKESDERSRAIFSELANPKWDGQIRLRGEDIEVGELINFTSKKYGISNIKLRTKQITHIITAQTGWITTLRVEEDELEQEVGL